MTRIVKEHAVRRGEILDSAQRLIYSKGYESMTIQDILDDLEISKGAFYHYFDSKQSLLEALTEQMLQALEQLLSPVAQDPGLSALEKLQLFFSTLIRWKTGQKTLVASLLRVWFTDDNAIVRQKIDAATHKRLAPLLTVIMRQGVEEAVFTTAYPEQAAEVVLSLIRGLQDSLAGLLLMPNSELDEQTYVKNTVAFYTAYMDALERVLGTPSGSLKRMDTETVNEWIVLLREDGSRSVELQRSDTR